MLGRIAFLSFLAGMLLGAWVGREHRPQQLPVRVHCAPALERI